MRKSGKGYRVAGGLGNTARIMRNTFWVGVYPGLTAEMLDYMIEKVRQFVGGARNEVRGQRSEEKEGRKEPVA